MALDSLPATHLTKALVDADLRSWVVLLHEHGALAYDADLGESRH